ncbi:MAG TPA: hypoxanthine phosphoribosyltransferase [Tissierellia bacterium]|nr:hypoxanthine phosphoribosyltransferase [Tissierellia bacterium]
MKQLFSQTDISERVRQLAGEIDQAYPKDAPLVAIGILKGSFIFMADLVRAMDRDVTLDFIALSSYGDATETTGVVRLLKDLDVDIKGKDVIIVEDIVDTGLTLEYLRHYLQQRDPKSVRIATLLDKVSRRQVEMTIDYVGFEIEDGFVVGYGIDYAQQYRNLPWIGIIE